MVNVNKRTFSKQDSNSLKDAIQTLMDMPVPTLVSDNTLRFRMKGRYDAPTPYHYKISGLNEVVLLNGFIKTEDGVTITNVNKLHIAIAKRLIVKLPKAHQRFIVSLFDFKTDTAWYAVN